MSPDTIAGVQEFLGRNGSKGRGGIGRALVVATALLLTTCSGGVPSDEYVEIETTGLYAATLDYLFTEPLLGDPVADLMYVINPSLNEWTHFCGSSDAIDVEASAVIGEPCDLFWSIEDDAAYEYTESALTEIEDGLSPAVIRIVKVRADALLPADGAGHVLPVRDDGSLIAFGVPLESDGVIYLPVALRGSGALIVAIRGESGWNIDSLLAWQA